jgi:Skp family chaperone for outer membrane proteins
MNELLKELAAKIRVIKTGPLIGRHVFLLLLAGLAFYALANHAPTIGVVIIVVLVLSFDQIPAMIAAYRKRDKAKLNLDTELENLKNAYKKLMKDISEPELPLEPPSSAEDQRRQSDDDH